MKSEGYSVFGLELLTINLTSSVNSLVVFIQVIDSTFGQKSATRLLIKCFN